MVPSKTFPFESRGKYTILVRAYDKAGNFTESKSVLSIVSPLIYYTGKGIQIGKLFLPWWLIYLLIGGILILTGSGVYNILKRRNLAKRLKKEVAEAEKEIEDVRKLEERIHEMRVLEEEARKESERLAERLRNKGKLQE